MSECLRCGYCCRDWIGGDPAGTCEHLVTQQDGRTHCGAWERLDEINRAECRALHTLAQAPSLPDCCGYIIAWREQGLIQRGPDGRCRFTT